MPLQFKIGGPDWPRIDVPLLMDVSKGFKSLGVWLGFKIRKWAGGSGVSASRKRILGDQAWALWSGRSLQPWDIWGWGRCVCRGGVMS